MIVVKYAHDIRKFKSHKTSDIEKNSLIILKHYLISIVCLLNSLQISWINVLLIYCCERIQDFYTQWKLENALKAFCLFYCNWRFRNLQFESLSITCQINKKMNEILLWSTDLFCSVKTFVNRCLFWWLI